MKKTIYRTCLDTPDGLTVIISNGFYKVLEAGQDWTEKVPWGQQPLNVVDELYCKLNHSLPFDKFIWYCDDIDAYFVAPIEPPNENLPKSDECPEDIFFKRYEVLLSSEGFTLLWIEPFSRRFGNRYLFIGKKETFMFAKYAPEAPLFCDVAHYADGYVGVSIVVKNKNRFTLYAGCDRESITIPRHFSDIGIPEENIELACYTGWNEKLSVTGTLGKGGYVKIYTRRSNNARFQKRIQFRKGELKSQNELLSICLSALDYALSKDRNNPNVDPPFSSFKIYD